MHMNETKSVLTCCRSFFLFFKNFCPNKLEAFELGYVLMCLTSSVGFIPVNWISGSHKNSIIQNHFSMVTLPLSLNCITHPTVCWGIFSMSLVSIYHLLTLSSPVPSMSYYYDFLPKFSPPMFLHNLILVLTSHMIGRTGLLATHIYSKFNFVPR